ncbi:rCG62031 [Rattus norvegicus]|uniref:RCG62031 n=1 Tax=Rattus norvegicus TaxID=10116 RepID=A6HAN3_RAT|nr:rCG62031 [Rattus norvegicus]
MESLIRITYNTRSAACWTCKGIEGRSSLQLRILMPEI